MIFSKYLQPVSISKRLFLELLADSVRMGIQFHAQAVTFSFASRVPFFRPEKTLPENGKRDGVSISFHRGVDSR